MRDALESKTQLNRRSFLKGAGSLASASILAASSDSKGLAQSAADVTIPPIDLDACLETGGPHVCLAGTWAFRLDPKNEGSSQRWFEREIGGDTNFLPGSTDQAGYGERTHGPADGHLSRPFIYTGPAWYECHFEMPQDWLGTRVSLFLERCHWQTSLWLDGKPCGTQNSLSVPHVYDLSTELAAGTHRLTICVDNTIKINLGATAHAITEQTQTNWNGIIGRIELRSVPVVCIEHVRTFADNPQRRVRLEVLLQNVGGSPVAAVLRGSVRDSVRDVDSRASMEIEPFSGEKLMQLELTLPEPLHLWDEYQPSPYMLELQLAAQQNGRPIEHTITMPLALRNIATRNTQFTLNGRPIFLRGTVENAIFPLTAFPPMELDPWRRIFRIIASYGMNHLRFHSYCPPEAAFIAADEAGFLLHVELPVFSHHVASTPGLPQFMREEGKRILQQYGNHPSFTMLCMGNELKEGWDFLDDLVSEFKAFDGRRLYTYSTNNGRDAPGASSDYWVTEETKHGRLRIDKTRFGAKDDGTLYDFSKAIAGFRVPVVAHELGQWAVYPSYDEIEEYIGVLKPRNLEVFRTQLGKRGIGDLAVNFQQASGRFAAQIYKEDIESALRTSHLGGFQLLQLSDYPGQQEALVGMLDSFWNIKCLITPAEFCRFCGPTVPLCRFEKFAWDNSEIFEADVEVVHYGAKPIRREEVRWTAKDDTGRLLLSGMLSPCSAVSGELVPLGKIRLPLRDLHEAARVTIEVRVGEAVNSWRIWAYPRRESKEAGSSAVTQKVATENVVTENFEDAVQRLQRGESVILCLAPGASGPSLLGLRFLPVFWSFAMFKKQPGVLGVLCDPSHPALRIFPTDFHADWQWWELMQGTQAFILDDLPADISPIVQVIDDFHRNHKLGAVLEARVGEGRLLLTSFPLAADLSGKPVQQQMLASLQQYAASDAFAPQAILSLSSLEKLMGSRTHASPH